MRKVMERFYNGDNPPIIDDKPKVTFKQQKDAFYKAAGLKVEEES